MSKNTATEIIGCNIRNMRKLRGLTLNQMAEKCGITAEALRKYEKGERSLSVEEMVIFADVLNCSEQNFIRGLNGRPVESPKEIRRLDADEHEIFEHISTEFDGNRKALIIATGVCAALPAKRRREVLLFLNMQADDSVHCGEIASEELPRGMEYMQEALGKLFEL